MNQAIWSSVDDYFSQLLIPEDQALLDTLRESEAAGLPAHNVAPNQGKFLYLLAKIQGANKILEIGTLGGYSTIWLARALPEGGHLLSLEANSKNAEVAARNIEKAGLSSSVSIHVGNAIDTLPKLLEEGEAPFDFIFIDADKPSNPVYLEWSLKLTRPGSVIVGDNVVREGAVVDSTSTDPKVRGVRHFFELMAGNPRLSATAIQTVGSKGYDGFTLAIVN
jgi:predicted O-methyltransferase YrrM